MSLSQSRSRTIVCGFQRGDREGAYPYGHHELGPVWIQDSQSSLIVIQALGWTDSFCTDAPMGEDGAALSWASRGIPAGAAITTGCLSKPCCGLPARASPWRDLPRPFGNWITVYTALSRLGEGGRLEGAMFDAVSDEPDMEYVMVDATIVKVHRHGQGRKRGTQNQAHAAARRAE